MFFDGFEEVKNKTLIYLPQTDHAKHTGLMPRSGFSALHKIGENVHIYTDNKQPESKDTFSELITGLKSLADKFQYTPEVKPPLAIKGVIYSQWKSYRIIGVSSQVLNWVSTTIKTNGLNVNANNVEDLHDMIPVLNEVMNRVQLGLKAISE